MHGTHSYFGYFVPDRIGLTITGTLGIIASAKRRGIIPAARPIFKQIQKQIFGCPYLL
jgi:predicted nucleic acid-binding protein